MSVSPSAAGGKAPRRTFQKSARLLKRAEFQRVYNQGRRLTLPDLTVFWLRRGEAASPVQGAVRVGFTVPRAVGGAVVRNRVRRRTREAVRLRLAQLALPVDMVINPRRSVLQAEFAALERQVADVFA